MKARSFCGGEIVYHKPTKRYGWVVGHNFSKSPVQVCFSNAPGVKAETVRAPHLSKCPRKPLQVKKSDIGREVEIFWVDAPNDIGLIVDVDRKYKSVTVASTSGERAGIGLLTVGVEFSQIVRLGPKHKFQMTPMKTKGPLLPTK